MDANAAMHRLILEERPYRPDEDSSIVMLGKDMMTKLAVQELDHVLLRGKGFRQTVCSAQEQKGLDRQKVRVSGSSRSSLHARAGDRITVCSFPGVPSGEHVRFAPLESASLEASEDLLATYLLPHFGGANRPVSRGDTFIVRVGSRPVEFQVMTVSPGESVIVDDDTQIECDEMPARREFENKHAPVSPRVPFSPMITVSVRDLGSEELLDQVDLLRTTAMTEVKERMRDKAFKRLVDGQEATRSRTFLAMGAGIKLVYQRRGIEDDETFESDAYEATVDLTAVLFVKTFSACTWGDRDGGGNSDYVKDRLAGGIREVVSTVRAFAALTTAGGVFTWGDPRCGGDCSLVEQVVQTNVLKVFTNGNAFAALKKGGNLVTWGDPEGGGDSSAVRRHLQQGISKVVGNDNAFCALKDTGQVVTWGLAEFGGDSSAVATQLADHGRLIEFTDSAFAVVKSTGEVVTWGNPASGGDKSKVANQLHDITSIVSNRSAFAVLRQDGMAFSWGDPLYCGVGLKGRAGQKLHNDCAAWHVEKLYSNRNAFAAVKSTGQAVSWGSSGFGGDSSLAADDLHEGVSKILSNDCSFVAVKWSGSVVSWGAKIHGGDSSAVADQLSGGVSYVECNPWAYAAVKESGSVVTWGEHNSGGDSTLVADQLADSVASIHHTERAFAALKVAGAVVCWGEGSFGGDTQGISDQLEKGVKEVCASQGAFAALKESGRVLTWGDRNRGGDCCAGVPQLNHPEHIQKLGAGVSHLYSNGLAFVALREGPTYQC